jgi:guanylate kinase
MAPALMPLDTHDLSAETPDLAVLPWLTRMRAVRDFLTSLVQQTCAPFSLAICGSAVIGTLRADSDIELLIVAAPDTADTILDCPLVRHAFGLSVDSKVRDALKTGDIDAIRFPESDFLGVRFCVNLFTTTLCQKISVLDDGPVLKFRDSPKHERAIFRGFSYHRNGDSREVDVSSAPFATGYVSETRIVQMDAGQPFFHIIGDKFFTAVFTWDELNARQYQHAFRNAIRAICHGDPTGFLHNRLSASRSQLERISRDAVDVDLEEAISAAQPRLCQVSGPSGVGKDTVIRALLERFPTVGTLRPHTTRTRRPGCSNEYSHVTEQEFLSRMLDDAWLFWHYDGEDSARTPKYYGILRSHLRDALANRSYILFSVGNRWAARFFKSRFPRCTTILLSPQSTSQVLRQLRSRGTDTEAEICLRADPTETATVSTGQLHDYVIINPEGSPHVAINEVTHILGLSND